MIHINTESGMVGMCARTSSCISMLHVFGKMQTTEFYYKEFITKITSFEQPWTQASSLDTVVSDYHKATLVGRHLCHLF